MATEIEIANITSNVTVSQDHVVSGDGVFDALMETVNKHIGAQFDLGRLKGPEYATVYLGSMQSALAQAVQFSLNKDSSAKQADLTSTQIDELVADGTVGRDIKERQMVEVEVTGSTDRDIKERQTVEQEKQVKVELFKSQLSSWTSIHNSNKSDNVPTVTGNTSIDALYTELKG